MVWTPPLALPAFNAAQGSCRSDHGPTDTRTLRMPSPRVRFCSAPHFFSSRGCPSVPAFAPQAKEPSAVMGTSPLCRSVEFPLPVILPVLRMPSATYIVPNCPKAVKPFSPRGGPLCRHGQGALNAVTASSPAAPLPMSAPTVSFHAQPGEVNRLRRGGNGRAPIAGRRCRPAHDTAGNAGKSGARRRIEPRAEPRYNS